MNETAHTGAASGAPANGPAADGPAALERLHGGERYDLLISDIVMPGGMSGVELARAAHARDARLPIVLTTGYAGERLSHGASELAWPLLRSYRNDEWPRWLQAAGVVGVEPRGPVFDSSLALASAAAAGAGVALLPLRMFEQDLADGRLLQPFAQTLVLGRYWLTRLRSRAEREPLRRFRLWLQAQGQA